MNPESLSRVADQLKKNVCSIGIALLQLITFLDIAFNKMQRLTPCGQPMKLHIQ